MSDMREETEDEISLLDLAITIKENIKLLVLAPIAAGVVALGGSFLIPPTFTASTSFLQPQQQQGAAAAMLQGLGALGGLAGAASGLKNPADQYVAFIKSRTVQDALVKRFALQKRYEAELHEDALRALEGAARISAGKDGLIKVEVDDREPAFAAQLANAHLEELRKLLDRLAVTEAQQRRAFYEKQLEQTKAKLAVAQSALQRSGINEGALRAEPKMAAEAYAALKAAVTASQVRLQSMRSYLTEQSPEFRLAQSELGALQSQLSKAESASTAAADDDYIVKYRDFKYQETLFEMFAKQFELAKLDEARDGAVIQVVDMAQTPERKSKPKKAMIAVLATLATGFVLLLFVFVRQAWRNGLQDEATAQKLKQLY
ncbi:MAG TPA: Wzz/FepE/Etk N-terminal domain-containing protein [Aquabacterium sp.]|nr:Wzz/FepE/Etk N-terminal domain-containing protein [Aquabacterium sp.]HRH29769.1 Wzz/FepE/Etk N-terminal domain-containing protein [Aquabacterium sp.]